MKNVFKKSLLLFALITIFALQFNIIVYANEIEFIGVMDIIPPIIDAKPSLNEPRVITGYEDVGITITNVAWYDGEDLISGDDLIERGQLPELRLYYELDDGFSLSDDVLVEIAYGIDGSLSGDINDEYISGQFEILDEDSDYEDLLADYEKAKAQYELNEDYSRDGISFWLSFLNNEDDLEQIQNSGDVILLDIEDFNTSTEGKKYITPTFYYKGLFFDWIGYNITVGDIEEPEQPVESIEDLDPFFFVEGAILEFPDSMDKVDDGDISDFVFGIQLVDSTHIVDFSEEDFEVSYDNNVTILESDNVLVRYYPKESLSITFKSFGSFVMSVEYNDSRFYNNKNDSKTYSFSSDYEVLNQTLYNTDKEYPDTYDLRDKIDIEVEDQGGFGLCWDFAFTKALETTYAMKYGENVNLAEMYPDYMTYIENRGTRYELHSGGDAYDYYNEIIRSGICSEEELPYDEENEYEYEDVKNTKKEVLPLSVVSIDGNLIKLNRTKKEIIKVIKEHLSSYGGVSAAAYFSQELYDDEDYTFFLPAYCREDGTTSHELTIIGWDDNFPKEKFKREAIARGGNTKIEVEPEEDGAWIVLNSWGTEYGDNGIFYLSYETDLYEILGFLDAIPYPESRKEYTYVENQYDNYKGKNIDLGHKKYFYQEFDISGDNEYITDVTVANASNGTLYYVDDYESIEDIDFENLNVIGDFYFSDLPARFSFLSLIQKYPWSPNFVFDEPVKINGNKVLLILEVDGDYVKKAYFDKDGEVKTYYTDDELSTNWEECIGNIPFYMHTVTIEPEETFEPENGLPMVIIRVDESDEAIKAAQKKNQGHIYGTIDDMNSSIDHSTRCVGTVEIILPDGYESEYGSTEIPNGEQLLSYIRGRGNITWGMPKKPYKIKFMEKQSFLGMGSNKEWGLLANALDDTLTHNAVAMWLGNQMDMPYTIKMVPVEVIMEGTNTEREYLGSYYLTELVDIGKSRVNIPELDPEQTEDITGGYLLSLYYEPQDSDEPRSTVFTTENGEITFINQNPYFESGDLTVGQEAQREYIRDYINQIDDLIMNNEVIDKKIHNQIDSLMDLKSTADYWLIQEFIVNFDAYKTSSNYLYKTKDENGKQGKLYWGPLWDFDLIHYLAGSRSTEGFNRSMPFAWLDKLRTSDETFVQLLKDEWTNKLDGIIEELVKPGGQLDQYKERQRDAWDDDCELWHEDEGLDYDEVFEEFRSLLVDRRNWFNEHLDDIGKVYFTVSFVDNGKVVKEMKVRGNTTINEVDIKAEKKGYLFNGWVNSETKEDVLSDLILGGYVYEPAFISVNEIGNDAVMYFANYEVWANLEKGEYDNNTRTFYPSEYYDNLEKSVKWTSSNENVATVDVNGVVHLLDVGETKIKGTLYNGTSKTYLLHVYSDEQEFNDAPTKVNLEKEKFTIEVGKTGQVIYHLLPDPIDPSLYISIDYEMDNEGIIEFDSSCLTFIGLKEGKVNVTIKFENYETEEVFTKNVEINVKAKGKGSSSGGAPTGTYSSSSDKTEKKTIWSKVDDWALEEMNKAEKLNLIPELLEGKDFTSPATREEFAAIAVKLYEALTGKEAEIIYSNPFKDTNNKYVLLAYSLGIVKGVSETEFGNGPITREQMATMIARALIKAGIKVEVDLNEVIEFSDDKEMHDWSRVAIYFMAKNGIVKGIGDNTFGNKGNAKIEEAIAITLRCIEIFKK